MGQVIYDVPLVTQGQSPICWPACVAMIVSERRRVSITVDRYTNGFDPSSASVASPSNMQMPAELRQIQRAGFTNAALGASGDEVENLLRTRGPFIFRHFCKGFPYGSGWGPVTDPAAKHSVVITGYDSSVMGGLCWMNNPWGNKDRALRMSAVLTAIKAWTRTGDFQVSYWDP